MLLTQLRVFFSIQHILILKKREREEERKVVKEEPFLCVYGSVVYSEKLRIT